MNPKEAVLFCGFSLPKELMPAITRLKGSLVETANEKGSVKYRLVLSSASSIFFFILNIFFRRYFGTLCKDLQCFAFFLQETFCSQRVHFGRVGQAPRWS